jgi:hypothetical protein
LKVISPYDDIGYSKLYYNRLFVAIILVILLMVILGIFHFCIGGIECCGDLATQV